MSIAQPYRIAVIPARGGSKRIPRKNIKPFQGKPIIAYSIEAAIDSQCFDRVIVSTDDADIAEVAKRYGAEVPFVRPENISDDYTPTVDVIKHAITKIENEAETVDYVCCIYATAPFVTARYVRDGYEKITDVNAQYAFSATEFPFPIQRAIKLDQDSRVTMFQPEHYLSRSQDLEPAYHDAGQFYWGTASAFKNNLAFFAEHSVAVVLPRSRVQDIDTEEDWQKAELMYKILESENNA